MTENIDKSKNYERKDQFGNPLLADWAFMYLVNAGREELEKSKIRNKDIVNISEEGLARDLYNAIGEATTKEDFNKYKDLLLQDYNEIIGYILNKEIDFEKALNNEEAIISDNYNGYVPEKLIVSDFQSKINNEYDNYKKNITKNFTKEGIFDKAYEISFYTEMHDYFNSLDEGNVEDIKDYVKFDFSIGYLYTRYLKNEFASIANGAEINDFLDNEVEREKRLTRQKDLER